MGVDLRPYGKLPALAVWCFFGTCFYSFIAYQMFNERGKKNRVSFLLISFSFSQKFILAHQMRTRSMFFQDTLSLHSRITARQYSRSKLDYKLKLACISFFQALYVTCRSQMGVKLVGFVFSGVISLLQCTSFQDELLCEMLFYIIVFLFEEERRRLMCFVCMEHICILEMFLNTANEPLSTPPYLLFASITSCMGNGHFNRSPIKCKMEDDYKTME